MQEQRVRVETAQLAKQKGFNWECDTTLNCEEAGNSIGTLDKVTNSILLDYQYAFPTQSHLQTWLRKEHLIFVEVTISTYNEPVQLVTQIRKLNKDREYVMLVEGHYGPVYPHHRNDEYEQALEQGLQAALKLIK